MFSGASKRADFFKYFLDPTYNFENRFYKMTSKKLEVLVNVNFGTCIKAPSVVLEVGNKLIIGQPFESYIAIVKNPDWLSLNP